MYLAKLKADFQAMDADGNGVVTKEDLRQKAKDIEYYITEEELESTIQSMDENEDGKITLEEFVAATVSCCRENINCLATMMDHLLVPANIII